MVLRLTDLIHCFGKPFNDEGVDFDTPVGQVCTDTRKLQKGDFYIALCGEHYDGHEFLVNAYELGSQAAFISFDCSISVPQKFLHWRVKDTLEAYQKLACLHREDLEIPVVAITGSVGKTTTKELISFALMSLGEITFTYGNNNNDIGVPQTLLNANSNSAAIVLEMGMRGLGQIKKLSCCSKPDIAVITNIGTAHLAHLGSRENIALAKCEITACLKPDGVVIIPAGDKILEQALLLNWQGRIIRVSLDVNYSNDSTISSIRDNYTSGKIDYTGILIVKKWLLECRGYKFQLPFEGVHNAKNFMYAIAVADQLGISLECLHRLNIPTPSGRNNILSLASITVLDETYNASPESVKASLDLLALKPGRHFAVLGTMLELGKNSVRYHQQIVEYAASLGIDGLIICSSGLEADAMAISGRTIEFLTVVSNPEDAFLVLKKWLNDGDCLLLKASRNVKLERLIPLLKNYF
ncbi:UDP-N-acetylmuramoyl-tripeptide--D-alanyl-D-alanine ligase [Prochlorococcus marinus]|uniref:UDP-N-acetylmuramoyl-tripeptide--D-alanyl-D- alanine ligase n=1 Tax=Prochlorococcus marinus TaxID=1219 RepID=UPI0022B48ECA|nr:UDP-N-acetylmuramoyl-tripeptide--D-alanyl-D-alanine ligase [Prochlorococcus marinus]